MNVYQKLEELGILPVIHISKAEWAEPLAQALTAGGIDALEVVFRSENAAEILSTLKRAVSGDENGAFLRLSKME